MGLSLQAVTKVIATMLVVLLSPGISAQADNAPEFGVSDTGPSVPALVHVKQLIEAGKLEEGLAAAQEVIAHPPQTYVGTRNIQRSDQMNKARAYNLEGYALVQMGKSDEAFEAWSRAAEMGDVDGLRNVGYRLMLKVVRSKDPSQRDAYTQRMSDMFFACAELADPACIQIVSKRFESEQNQDAALYWMLLLACMTKQAQDITTGLNAEEKEQMERAMRANALAPPVPALPAFHLPGRSPLTSALIDLHLRSKLQRGWRFFWDERSNVAEVNALQELTADSRSLKEEGTPYADEYLLLAEAPATAHANVVAVGTARPLVDYLQNGDTILVRCGQLTHVTPVWSVDGEHVLLLDQFYEFWQPTHNSCSTSMKVLPYKYSRQLVEVPRSSVKSMLQGIFTVRDAREPSPLSAGK